MTELNDISYEIRNGNAGRGALNADGITGLVMNGVAVDDLVDLGAIYTVYTLKDVEALGINKAYDEENLVLVWQTFYRHFLRNPRVETHFMLVAQTVTQTQMWDKANNYMAKLVKDTNGVIRVAACKRNPVEDYTVTSLNGMDADSYNALAKAQQLVEDLFAGQRLLPTVGVEIRSLSSTASSAANLRALTHRNVTAVAINDPAVWGLNDLANAGADVGTFTGLASKATVSQNIGEHSDGFNLQIIAEGVYLKCALSSGQLVGAADLDTLMTKGYLFGHAVIDFDGFWLNDYPTCTSLETDDYAYGYINRIAFKALQVVRKKLMPLVRNKGMQTDPFTHKFTEDYRSYLESESTDTMERQLQGNIVAGSAVAYINPDVNLRTSNGAFTVEISFTEIIQGKKITLSVGLNPNK